MSSRKLIYTASIAALAYGLSQGAFAAGNTTPSAQSSAPQPKATEPATNLSHGDRKFLENAAQGGMVEVQLGKLAEQKASSEQVKQFGKRMAADHQKANDELKKIAANRGFNLPVEMSGSARREYDKMQGKSGADFDREYMKEMVSDHKKDLKEFQSEAKSSKDADLKNFATSTLPTLQQHLDLAQQTENAVNSGSTAQKTSSAR
jgi:putative membrane protein